MMEPLLQQNMKQRYPKIRVKKYSAKRLILGLSPYVTTFLEVGKFLAKRGATGLHGRAQNSSQKGNFLPGGPKIVLLIPSK